MTKIKTTIAVILGSSPRVSAIAKNASAFDISGDRFEDVGLGVHNGFYDFLRNRAGAVTDPSIGRGASTIASLGFYAGQAENG